MVDYQYYIDEFLLGRKPLVEQTDFKYWERQALTLLDAFTFGRVLKLEQPDENVKFCLCELMESMYSSNAMTQDRNGVTSEKDGTWSASYESTSDVKQNESSTNYTIIRKYLGNTGLLFAGVTNEIYG